MVDSDIYQTLMFYIYLILMYIYLVFFSRCWLQYIRSSTLPVVARLLFHHFTIFVGGTTPIPQYCTGSDAPQVIVCDIRAAHHLGMRTIGTGTCSESPRCEWAASGLSKELRDAHHSGMRTEYFGTGACSE